MNVCSSLGLSHPKIKPRPNLSDCRAKMRHLRLDEAEWTFRFCFHAFNELGTVGKRYKKPDSHTKKPFRTGKTIELQKL